MARAAWGCLVCLVHREHHGYSCRARTCAGQGGIGIWVALIPKCVRFLALTMLTSTPVEYSACLNEGVWSLSELSFSHSVLKEKCDWTHRGLQKTDAWSDNKKIKSVLELRLDLVFLKWGPLCKTTVTSLLILLCRECLTCDTFVELMCAWALCRLHCIYNSSCLSQFFL